MVDIARLTELYAEFTESFAAIRHRHEPSESERDSRLADRLDSLRRLDLQHDELLRRTVWAEDWASFLEVVHEDYKHILDGYEELIALQGELLEQQMSAYQKLDEIRALRLQVTEPRAMLEGMLKGRDAQKTIQAKNGARGKLANDPKQAEKDLVYDCWQSWQKKPDDYKGKAAFARDMLDKCEHLESQKKIEDWCREWERKAGTQPAE